MVQKIQNKGFKKVPVLWLSAERAFQTKNDKDIRDSGGHFILPLMTVTRISMTKDPTFRGSHYAHLYENQDQSRMFHYYLHWLLENDPCNAY